MPGTYSLIAHSKEEEVTRDFICIEDYVLSIVVCDAVCLERNLNLALQVLAISPKSHINFLKPSNIVKQILLGDSSVLSEMLQRIFFHSLYVLFVYSV